MKLSIVKSFCISLLMSLCFSSIAKAQNLSKSESISFLGIDYSHVQLIGEMAHWGENSMSTEEIVSKYFVGWNQLFVNEAKKYDVNKFFKTSNMQTQIGFFDKINAATNPNKLIQQNSPTVTTADVENWVKKYNYSSTTTPYSIFLVATELNKGKEVAKYYIVLVDKNAKKYYVSAEQSGKPGGFGFRNYWASSFFKVLQNAKNSTKTWFSK